MRPVALAFCLGLAACGNPPDPIVGKWHSVVGTTRNVLWVDWELDEDGRRLVYDVTPKALNSVSCTNALRGSGTYAAVGTRFTFSLERRQCAGIVHCGSANYECDDILVFDQSTTCTYELTTGNNMLTLYCDGQDPWIFSRVH